MKKKKNIKKKKVARKGIKKSRAISKTKKRTSRISTSQKKKKKKTSSSKSVKKSARKSNSVNNSAKKTVKKEKVLKTKSKKITVLGKNQLKNSKTKRSNTTVSAALKENTSTGKVKKRKIAELKKELEYLNKRDQKEVFPKDAEGRSYCRDEHCDQPAVTDVYCRYHYLALWKYLQTKKQFSDNRYIFHKIQDIMKSLGEESLQFILRDLKNEKTFEVVAKEMNFSIKKDEEILSIESDTSF